MPEDFEDDYEVRRKRRSERMEEMRKKKRKQQLIRKLIRRFAPVVVGAVILVVLLCNGRSMVHRLQGYDTLPEDIMQTNQEAEDGNFPQSDTIEAEDGNFSQSDSVEADENTMLAENSDFMKDAVEILHEQAVRVLSNEDGGEERGDDLDADAVTSSGESKVYTAQATEATTSVDEEVQSTNGIFIDLESGTILFDRDAHTRINPASMTKVLTVLVAAEQIDDWSDTFEITPEITDYAYVHDCSAVGFAKNEVVTVKDLFYGTILCSGGDAALGLATYVAGSQEAFVEMMNDKLRELKLSDTAHFTNCVGLYDEDHYCTVYDIAMIMEAAIARPECREILSAHTYTTSSTAEHPDGITISNWFLRRIEDKDTGGEVICGKTGFVAQSGSCAVSYGMDASGKEYVCATVNAHSSWRCIYDHVELYKRFAKAET